MRRTAFLLLLLAGCEPSLKIAMPARATDAEPTTSTIAASGVVRGRVSWQGPRPTFEPITVYQPTARSFANPRNVIICNDGTVMGAVVFLRKVPTTKAWSAAPASVEIDHDGLYFLETGTRTNTSFLRLGDTLTMTTRLEGITGVRGRGADFFTRMLPSPSEEATRICIQPGRVELTSASGQFWSCLDLFVCEHPHYAKTDAQGEFRFREVPVGEFEIVCWHPNWRFVGHERNPETGVIVRKTYAPAAEKRSAVRVTENDTTTVDFMLADEDFRR
jgi:hypothetical protein